ncbi:sugar phosphate nucleotidyltransferase [Sunxiuqinia elliptica]|uniref:Glucose-1-phosphate cytidylyltransferase n=1 Tax=Sunxiuqinia elliptica TaxID=655355 RepID=A0A4R6H593_9BACT|nr:sugar phosphate nucleotidyltransferase [Sunxiuqinia elliptica]TDO02661.1 glucose-1-phosphate cytidylyltransferase [Sunxiuqinia elliptica]TDO58601.1 glucose-1-phosphate cytidylyltransferase [Sunxiuqinia elliptica]
MKVVLFCGGMGIRLRDYSDQIPKPMVTIGYRPVLWNIMKYYASYGHKDFILCLGYKADVIKNYFINYDETISNDFVYTQGGKNIELLNSDISDWKITFVDTGLNANIGMRLMQVKEHLKGEKMFLANYSDGLTDMDLNEMVGWFDKQKDKTAAFMAYQPTHSFHVVKREDNGRVNEISHIGSSGLFINTGYFVFRNEIFDHMEYGDELVEEPFNRLIEKDKLISWEHKGFWASMDTFKDKKNLDDIYAAGSPPWEVWTNMEQHPRKRTRMEKIFFNYAAI